MKPNAGSTPNCCLDASRWSSVGHRPSLLAYHNIVLELKTDGTGELMPTEQYMTRSFEEPHQRSAV
ncbi:MAG: hypothetical protein WDN31_01545 [Hyphomicrobium sp.]